MCSLPRTEFVATSISFKKDYWCRNCPFFFMFVANGGFGQVGKCSESIKALLVLVCPWLQQ